EAMSRRIHPECLIDRGDANGMACLARDMGGMVAHGASIAFAERVNGVEFVDVVAKAVEKLVTCDAAEAILRRHVGEQLFEFAGDIEGGGEARSALRDDDAAILACPIVEVLKQMLV
ncbi:hypothetical protein LTR94_035594, partial [Friedmanniomyces endolithicus]